MRAWGICYWLDVTITYPRAMAPIWMVLEDAGIS